MTGTCHLAYSNPNVPPLIAWVCHLFRVLFTLLTLKWWVIWNKMCNFARGNKKKETGTWVN